jgi:hypothetical protein
MTEITSRFIISLFEPATLIKQTMETRSQRIGIFDPTLTMNWLLRVVFDTPHTQDGLADYSLQTVISMFEEYGVPDAAAFVQRVFEMCVDTVATIIPEMAFDPNQKLSYLMINWYDVQVEVTQTIDDNDATGF